MADRERRYVYLVQRDDGLYYQNHGGSRRWVSLENAKIMSKGSAASVVGRVERDWERRQVWDHSAQVVRFLLLRTTSGDFDDQEG